MTSVDGAALLFLVLFTIWGALHGALRQTLGLLVLVAAFPIASIACAPIERAVVKVATLSAEGAACAAWATAWFGVVVVGGVLLHLAGPALARARLSGRWDAVFGASIGLAKGAVLLGLVVYGVLGWHPDGPVPALVTTLRASQTARFAAAFGRHATPALRLPFAVEVRAERVHRRIDAGQAP